MRNEDEKTVCVFHITGGTNQIMPNAKGLVQNFNIDRFAKPMLMENELVDWDTDSYSSNDEEPESLKLAERELCVYYTDKVSLKSFIDRVGACRDASDLANLVVNDMMKHTILTSEIAVKSHFIEVLLAFVHFTKGSSVGNIRQQIRKKSMEAFNAERDKSDSIRGR